MIRNRALALPPPPPDLVSLLEEVRQDPKIGPELVHTAYLPPCIEEHGELDPPLPEPIAQALGRGGVSRLWTHQTEGIAAVCRHPAVHACYRVTGPSLLVLMVRVADNAALTEMLAEFTRFGDTKTAVILSTDIDQRPIFADSAQLASA